MGQRFHLRACALMALVSVVLFSLGCEQRRAVYFYEPDLPYYDPGDSASTGGSGYNYYSGELDTSSPKSDVPLDLVVVPDVTITFDFGGTEDTNQPDSNSGDDTNQQPDLPKEVEIPIEPVERSCETVVRYSGPGSSVSIAGEFNGFSASANPMTKGNDGVWTATLDLAAGEYAYKLVIDGKWGRDPGNPYTKWQGNEENSSLRVSDCKLPGWKVLSAKANSDGSLDAVIQFLSANNQPDNEIDKTSVVVTEAYNTVTPDINESNGVVTINLTGLAPGKHSLRLVAKDKAGRETRRLFIPLWVEAEKFDWRDGSMYFVFNDRFLDSDKQNPGKIPNVPEISNYQGGDFEGVIQKLKQGYFTKLGVRSIWLSPVYDNPSDKGYLGTDGRTYTGFHGYWPIAPRGVEPAFGGAAKLKELVAEAHKKGIRIILDLVLNHTHDGHPYWQNKQGTSWFNGGKGDCVCGVNCDWNTQAEVCWFADYTPDLNYRDHEVVTQITEDTLWWIREFDIDGLRLDAVKHMPHVISRTISLRIRDEMEVFGPRVYLVGETFAGGNDYELIKKYIGPEQLDGQYDFTLVWTLLGVFAYDGNFFDLDNKVKLSESNYKGALMSPFLGNHDIARFINEACKGSAGCHEAGKLWDDVKAQGWESPPQSPDIEWPYLKMTLGFTFLLTQDGVPLIYYGDEIGLPGAGDPDNRRMMKFEPNLSGFEDAMLKRMRKIGMARVDSLALRRGNRITLHLEANLYAYLRFTGPGSAAVVVLNRDSQSRNVTLNIPGQLGLNGKTLIDRLSDKTFSVQNDKLVITGVPSWTGMILLPQP